MVRRCGKADDEYWENLQNHNHLSTYDTAFRVYKSNSLHNYGKSNKLLRMPIDSFQLDAVVVLARVRNFTLAASELRLTQPALSKRIQALETQLGTALFLRNPGGVELTEAGARVLRFAESTQMMERELRSELAQAESGEPAALVWIAGYSSILHMVVTPALAPFSAQASQSAAALHGHPTLTSQCQTSGGPKSGRGRLPDWQPISATGIWSLIRWECRSSSRWRAKDTPTTATPI